MNFFYKYEFACLFERDFGRPPKKWTIEGIHNLWVKACKRASDRRMDTNNYLNEIVKEIPKDRNGYHTVYYYIDDRICSYQISYDDYHKCYRVSFRTPELKTREGRLDFFIAEKRAFEMGEIYHKKRKIETHLQDIAFQILWRLVEEKLLKIYKNQNFYKQILMVEIAGIKYNIMADSSQYNTKFNFIGLVPNEVIKIT